MNKFSILSLAILLTAALIGFKGDARADKQKDDNNAKPGAGQRYCPMHPSDEEQAAMEQDFAGRYNDLARSGMLAEATGGVINVYFHVRRCGYWNCQRRCHRRNDHQSGNGTQRRIRIERMDL